MQRLASRKGAITRVPSFITIPHIKKSMERKQYFEIKVQLEEASPASKLVKHAQIMLQCCTPFPSGMVNHIHERHIDIVIKGKAVQETCGGFQKTKRDETWSVCLMRVVVQKCGDDKKEKIAWQ